MKWIKRMKWTIIFCVLVSTIQTIKRMPIFLSHFDLFQFWRFLATFDVQSILSNDISNLYCTITMCCMNLLYVLHIFCLICWSWLSLCSYFHFGLNLFLLIFVSVFFIDFVFCLHFARHTNGSFFISSVGEVFCSDC